jgi:hypothetical protein
MKRIVIFASLVILLGLALSFTQVFAAGPGVSAPKKTPAADTSSEMAPAQHGKGAEMKESQQAEKAVKKAAQQERKEDKDNKSPKERQLSDGENPHPTGKVVNFRGVIGGLSNDGSAMDITLKDGSSVTLDMSQNPRIHIPTMGKGTEPSNLRVGMQVSVHAVQIPEGGDPVAIAVQVIPGNPARQHLTGLVTSYEPGKSITIQGASVEPFTFDITNARVIPHDALISAIDQTSVTIVCLTSDENSTCTVQAVVVHARKK